MNLAVDIGNTRTKLGLFKGDQLVETYFWPKWSLEEFLAFSTNLNTKKVILSTVSSSLSQDEIDQLGRHFFFIQLNETTALPIVNEYETPETLGKDRLAAVVGANHLFPNQNCLVIDAGTCITLDVITAKGHFKGGNISPGLEMRMKAMHHFTANLPLVEPEELKNWLGTNTRSALINGAQVGTICEMDAFLALCQEKYHSINVILTGGDADFLAKQWKRKIFVHHNLVLRGLNKILDYNVQ
ncbi:MAG: type III pantothenate kinase [Bacteroidota bacterium]